MAVVVPRVAFSHPNRKRLLAWLEQPAAAAATDSVTAHVERCDRCADRLEELAIDASVDDDQLDREIGVALREVFEPPEGITDRVMRTIDDRERADRELNLFLGLFAIPSDAASLMLPDTSEGSGLDDNRHQREEEQDE